MEHRLTDRQSPHAPAGVQGRQTGDLRTVLLLRTSQLVGLLEVEPELVLRPEKVPTRSAVSPVTAGRKLRISLMRFAGNRDPPRQFRGAHPKRFQILPQRLARMEGIARHEVPPYLW